MTENYYTDKVLPSYCDAITRRRLQDPDGRWKLQEDGDSSHGINNSKQGLARGLKEAYWIDSHLHHPH